MAQAAPLEISALLRAILPIVVAEGLAISVCAAAFILTGDLLWAWIGVTVAALGSALMMFRVVALGRGRRSREPRLVEGGR